MIRSTFYARSVLMLSLATFAAGAPVRADDAPASNAAAPAAPAANAPKSDASAATTQPGASAGDAASADALKTPVVAPSIDLKKDSLTAYPKPSPFPISWELKFEHGDPKRIVVTVPGNKTPTVFWYMTYSVTNHSDEQANFDPDNDKERVFYPKLEMRTEDGSVIRSDDGIPPTVFDAIKKRENNKYMESPTQMGGRILLGADQQRDSVAIWQQPMDRMGAISIFATGMWGESTPATDMDAKPLKDAKGNEIELHKTLMMSYHVDGDEGHPGPVRKTAEEFIMR